MLGLASAVSTASIHEQRYSLSLDGTGDYLKIDGFASELSNGMAFTVSIWFKGDSNASAAYTNNTLFSAHTSTGGNVLRISVDNDGTNGIFYSDAGSGNTPSLGNVDLDDGRWHNVVVSRGGGADVVAKLYIDGGEAVDIENTNPSFDGATQVSVGQEYDNANATDFYEGSIGDIAFWDAALDSEAAI